MKIQCCGHQKNHGAWSLVDNSPGRICAIDNRVSMGVLAIPNAISRGSSHRLSVVHSFDEVADMYEAALSERFGGDAGARAFAKQLADLLRNGPGPAPTEA